MRGKQLSLRFAYWTGVASGLVNANLSCRNWGEAGQSWNCLWEPSSQEDVLITRADILLQLAACGYGEKLPFLSARKGPAILGAEPWESSGLSSSIPSYALVDKLYTGKENLINIWLVATSTITYLAPVWRQPILWHESVKNSYVKVKVAQLCPTLCNPIDYTVHGILQVRILEWVAFSFSRGSSQLRDHTRVSCIAGGFFTNWAIREAQKQNLKRRPSWIATEDGSPKADILPWFRQ